MATSRQLGFLTLVLIIAAMTIVAAQQSPRDPQPLRDSKISGSETSASAIAADRLHIAVLFLIERIEEAISRENARVQRTCASADDVTGCTVRETRAPSFHFVRVRRAPSFTAPIAGDLLVVGRSAAAGGLFDLVYRTAADGRLRTWIDLGDWGYGPYVSGVRRRGAWIGLSGAPFDGDVWIYGGTTGNLRGEVSSIAGEILELHDVRARAAGGGNRILPSGSYFITHVDRAGVVTFREELDMDMPCGDDVGPPAVMPPTFRAPASAFFDALGRPRFEVKYVRGC